MKRSSETGIYSASFQNALAYAKRNAVKENYSFIELVEDAKFAYILTTEETAALQEKLFAFCRKNRLYASYLRETDKYGCI